MLNNIHPYPAIIYLSTGFDKQNFSEYNCNYFLIHQF